MLMCYAVLYFFATPKSTSSVRRPSSPEDRFKPQVSQENTGESVLKECSILKELQVAGVADVVCLGLDFREGLSHDS